MLVVRGKRPILGTHEQRDVRGAVGQTVDRVRHDRLTVAKRAGGHFEPRERQIDDQTGPRDPPRRGGRGLKSLVRYGYVRFHKRVSEKPFYPYADAHCTVGQAGRRPGMRVTRWT